ncbi:PREDICTED: uncharacterized protein LOC106331168 [Brassica oleracea var. oleracea]|uniref:uncharacterized protein LOC106331168 n=1 Tax=Brassica oleracea var. oleracea TaxID=109376 RepID=UPI0006A73A24|nr:PREDICTED: uncharacterized protein LOC106331168 [Brassica oleracea var. oleracea]
MERLKLVVDDFGYERLNSRYKELVAETENEARDKMEMYLKEPVENQKLMMGFELVRIKRDLIEVTETPHDNADIDNGVAAAGQSHNSTSVDTDVKEVTVEESVHGLVEGVATPDSLCANFPPLELEEGELAPEIPHDTSTAVIPSCNGPQVFSSEVTMNLSDDAAFSTPSKKKIFHSGSAAKSQGLSGSIQFGNCSNSFDVLSDEKFKLVRSLKMLKVVRRLNKRNFSGISQRVKDQKFIVDGLQWSLLTLPDSATAREEHIQRQKLNVLLTAEEKYYRQRSRVRWADVGDRNTVFYHRVVTQHVTVNHIHFLKDEDGRVICTTEELKSHSAQYFQSILGVTDLPNSLAPMEELQDLLPFRCSELQQAYLSRTVLEPEIKGTIFSMPTNKSPGPDGYSIEFIRASWDVVGPDIINAVSEFFRNGRLLKDLNTTAITLIPKKPEACTLGDYRPISCCNIVFKVISKIIANQLKPILRVSVSPNQAAFLKGRSLGENVLLASELIRDYNKSSCLRSSMLKVDIRKAFDTVCWDFVIKILKAQGFPPLFVSWIQECITSPRFFVALNGELAGFFEGKKGLRQGDSISPYLFIMIMEVLSRLLNKAQIENKFQLHPLCNSPRITHLLFADDLLVFSDGSRASVSGIKAVMSVFREWSGLDMNEAKSEIFYGGYNDIQASVMADLSGFKRGSFPTRYLDLPLDPKKITLATLQPFLERITSQLHSWTVKILSFAGKVKLIYSVIYGMVNFWSSVFVQPKRFYQKVDSICSAFLWKNSTTSASGARVSWSSICTPKEEGGLGLRTLEEFDLVFRLKRFGGRNFWLVRDSQRFSVTVRSNGFTASFWYDFWTELGPLHLLFRSTASRSLRLPISATVADATRDSHWNLPPARSENAVTLQIILSTTPVPSPINASDSYLWRLHTGGFGSTFSTSVTWNLLRQRSPIVEWHEVFCGRFISSPPSDIPAAVSMCLSYNGIYASLVRIILKLFLQVLVYSLWRERNGRIFRDLNHHPLGFFRMVDRQMRDRLMSLSPGPNDAHSLLELYFWFVVPFS